MNNIGFSSKYKLGCWILTEWKSQGEIRDFPRDSVRNPRNDPFLSGLEFTCACKLILAQQRKFVFALLFCSQYNLLSFSCTMS